MSAPKRTDANQALLMGMARGMGASVADTHEVGDGFPDLVLAWRGYNLLVEVKTERGRYTGDQVIWRDEWRAPTYTVRTADELIELLLAICAGCGTRAAKTETGWRCSKCREVWDG